MCPPPHVPALLVLPHRDEALVDAVLRLPWPLEDVHFSNSYMDLLENLLSANAFFAVPTLHMLVLNLTYRASTGCHTHKDPTPRLFQPLLTHRPFKYPPTLRTCRWMHLGPEAPGAARQPGSLSETELTSMYRRVHQMLYTVTRIVPSALRVLMNLIREHFPHRRSGHNHPHATIHTAWLTSRVVFCFCRQSTREHVVYLRNLFLLLEYAPDLRGDVLATVIDRLLQIDVRHPCALRPLVGVRPRDPTDLRVVWAWTWQLELQDTDMALASGDDGATADDDDADEQLMFNVELEVRPPPPAHVSLSKPPFLHVLTLAACRGRLRPRAWTMPRKARRRPWPN